MSAPPEIVERVARNLPSYPTCGPNGAPCNPAGCACMTYARAALSALTVADLAALIAARDPAWCVVPREALEKIASRDFNCAIHQHGMAAACVAQRILGQEPTP